MENAASRGALSACPGNGKAVERREIKNVLAGRCAYIGGEIIGCSAVDQADPVRGDRRLGWPADVEGIHGVDAEQLRADELGAVRGQKRMSETLFPYYEGELLFIEPVAAVKRRYHVATLEDAFFAATGRTYEDEQSEEDQEREVFA